MIKRKNNSHQMTILPYSPGVYYITIWNKDLKDGINFPYETAIGLSEVQDIFFALTDSQIEKMMKDKK